jgi:hypothetical protein
MRERLLPSTLQKFLIVFILLALAAFAAKSDDPIAGRSPQAAAQQPANPAPNVDLTPSVNPQVANTRVCAPCIRATMNFLASDALRGRGSATQDEQIAATYIGAQLEQYGVEPAGDNGTYVQRGTLIRQNLTAPPELHYMTPGDGIPSQTMTWTHGKEMLVVLLSDANFRGALKRLDSDKTSGTEQEKHPGTPAAGKAFEGRVVLVTGQDRKKIKAAVLEALQQGAVAVVEPAAQQLVESWESRGKVLPELPVRLEGGGRAELGTDGNVFAVSEKALAVLKEIPDGVMFYMEAAVSAPKKSYVECTGKIPGSDPSLSKTALLLSAHLDHLGVGKPVKGDSIYNGADDDVPRSRCSAQLRAPLPRGRNRSVRFCLRCSAARSWEAGSAWFRRIRRYRSMRLP